MSATGLMFTTSDRTTWCPTTGTISGPYSWALNQAAVSVTPPSRLPLLEALRATRCNCQASAAMGCTALGIRAAVADLLALLDHPQWIAREHVVIGLGELAEESVVAALAPLLQDPADWTRQRTAKALLRIGGDRAPAALCAEFGNVNLLTEPCLSNRPLVAT